MKKKAQHSSGNVFRDLGFSPEEAANLRIRADLMVRRKSSSRHADSLWLERLNSLRFRSHE